MNIKRNIRIATVTAVAAAGLSTGISTPAMAHTPTASPAITLSSPAMADRSAPRSATAIPSNTTITNGPKPNVLTWRECWSKTYAAYREDGHSIGVSETAADLNCGKTEDEF